MFENETMIVFGGSVKALDTKGRFGGHLVLFGSADQTDASQLRDFFTPETDFGLDTTTKSRVLYQHALDPEIKNRKLAIGSLKTDKVGIWLEGQLALRDEYEKKIWEMVEAGKLGFSSGTAPHLIRREKQANGSHKISDWPLGLDASLTPNPAEPRTMVVGLKSLLDGIKGEHLGPRAEQSAALAAFRGTQDRLEMALYSTLEDPALDVAAKLERIRGGFDEARDTTLRVVTAVLATPSDGATKALPVLDAAWLEARLHLLDGLLDG